MTGPENDWLFWIFGIAFLWNRFKIHVHVVKDKLKKIQNMFALGFAKAINLFYFQCIGSCLHVKRSHIML